MSVSHSNSPILAVTGFGAGIAIASLAQLLPWWVFLLRSYVRLLV
jgi:hypothetical protein